MTTEDIELLRSAYIHAARSDDPDTHNGAVLVNPEGLVIATGCTRFPRGVDKLRVRYVRPTKYRYIEHAERNVIHVAARAGRSTEGATMYCPWFACHDCARAICEAGIVRVVGHKPMLDQTTARWKDSVDAGFAMMREAGVEIDLYDGRIGGVSHKFNNEIWYP